MYTVESITTHYFFCQIQRFIIHDSHMVTIPTDRAANVQHDFRSIKQQRRYLISYTFGRMEMAGIECHYFITACTIANIEII